VIQSSKDNPVKWLVAALFMLLPWGPALAEKPDHEVLAHLGRDLDSDINPNLVLPTSAHGLLNEADDDMLRAGVARCRSYYKAEKYLNAAQFCYAAARHHGAIGVEDQAEVVFLLAEMVRKGLGTGKNPQPKSSLRLVKYSADLGNIDAMHRFAMAHYRGEGVRRSYRIATEWLTYAAERGDVRSQLFLGELISGGLAPALNFEQAYFWYSLAARGGNKKAQRKREATEKLLLPMQLTQVDRRLHNWTPTPTGPLDEAY
jgi:TPR repeat protein